MSNWFIHAPFGIADEPSRGTMALRKRFCRSFHFERQAAAAHRRRLIVLSLGIAIPFRLTEVFRLR